MGVTAARGAGWGALLGAIGGYLLPYISGLATDDALISEVAIFRLIGFYAAPIGALWGLVAGLVTAFAVYPLAGISDNRLMGRIVGAASGVLTIVLMSAITFKPSLEIGGNETIGRVRERIFTFHLIPGSMAFLAGLVMTPRLLRRTRLETEVEEEKYEHDSGSG